MGEQKSVSKNKKLKFLYQLLPRYYVDEDELTAMDKLKKAIYQDTKKGTTIKTKLKKIEFDIERYSEKQRFLFYLTYLQLTHTNRPFIKRAHQKMTHETRKRPNQKLIANSIKFDVDYSFRNVGIQFLIAYDLYRGLELDEGIKGDRQFVEAYNDLLVLMHLQIEEYFRAKGKDDFKQEVIEKKRESLKRKESIEVLHHIRRYRHEEETIKENITILHLSNQRNPYETVLGFAGIQLAGYDMAGAEANQDENWGSCLYTLLFYSRYVFKVYEALTMRIYWEDEGQEEILCDRFYDFASRQSGLLGEMVELIREKLRTNILLDFAGRMFYQQERSEYLCQMKILDGLLKESQSVLHSNGESSYALEPGRLEDDQLNDMKPEELLNLMIPEKNRRPEGIRNTIKKKVKDTIRVLERLKEKYGIVWDTRNCNHIRAMYEELYQYNAYHYKDVKGYSGVLKHVKAGTASPGELLLLKEKQIRGLFRMKNKMRRYPAYVEAQTVSSESAVQIFASFEHWMES